MKQNKNKTNEKAITHIGKVLCDNSRLGVQKVMFVVIGVSYEDVALVRLFGHDSMNTVLEKKCCRLSDNISFPEAIGHVSTPLYADITKIIRKAITNLLPLLDKNNNKEFFRIPKEDIDRLLFSIKRANTISENIKIKFLP